MKPVESHSSAGYDRDISSPSVNDTESKENLRSPFGARGCGRVGSWAGFLAMGLAKGLSAAPAGQSRVVAPPAPPMPAVLPGTPGGPPATLPHGLRGVMEIPDPYAWVRSFAGVVGLLILCAFGFWLWWRKRPLPSAGPGIRPDDAARERLQRALAQIGEPGQFVAEVSAAVRTYLEARFGLRAPERTTEEFVEELRRNGALESGHREALGSFLGACDLVKFAGVRPQQPDLEELHLAALKLVNELTPAAPPTSDAAVPPRLEEGTYA